VPVATQGTQAWDRYAYVNNNPVRYRDPSGRCISPGDFCIEGWDDSYHQLQDGNTCAITSISVAASIILREKVSYRDIQPLAFTTYAGIGTIPQNQAVISNLIDPRVKATYNNALDSSSRTKLLENLKSGKPTVVSVAFLNRDVGHAMVVIGHDPIGDRLILFNPTDPRLIYEDEFVRNGRSFAEIWEKDWNIFIPAKSMVTLERNTSTVIPVSAGGDRRNASGVIFLQ
jgi:hypothetical protein